MTDPPDAYDEAVAAAVQHADAQNSGTKRARTVLPSLADIYVIGRDLQHRSSHKVGSDLSENDRFHAFFGCGANMALHLWLLTNQHYFTPMKPRFPIYSGHSSSCMSTQAWRLHVLQQVVQMVALTPKPQVCLANDPSHFKLGATCGL